MKKLLFLIILSMLFCFSVLAKEYIESEVKICTKDETLMCDLNENLLNGDVKFYNQDGSLKKTTHYKNGKKIKKEGNTVKKKKKSVKKDGKAVKKVLDKNKKVYTHNQTS